LLKAFFKDDGDFPNAAPLVVAAKSRPLQCRELWLRCECFASMRHIIDNIAQIELAFRSGLAFTEGNDFDARVYAALAELNNYATPNFAMMEQMQVLNDTAWAMPIVVVKAWWSTFDSHKQRIQRRALLDLVSKCQDVAQKTSKIPKFAHFLNDTLYNRSLVSRHLLTQVNKEFLAHVLVELKNIEPRVSGVYKALKLGPDMESDPDFKPTMDFVSEQLELTNKTAAITSAATIVQQSPVDEKPKRAVAMLEKRRHLLPKPLVAALEGYCDASGAAPAAKRRRCLSKTTVGSLALADGTA
jgi:hypothetical protein